MRVPPRSPAQILVPAGLTKRLRQQLQPAVAGHAADGEGAHKRRLVVTQLKEGQGDARQAAMDGLHLEDALAGLDDAQPGQGDQRKQEMDQLERLLFANRARLASAGQLGQQQAEEAPPLVPQQREAAGQGSSGAPPEGLLPMAGGAAPLGGGMLSQAFLHGLRRQPSLGNLLGSGSLGAPGSGRLSGDLGLLPLPAVGSGMGGAPTAAPEMQQQALPRPGDPALGGERLGGEDAFLLSKVTRAGAGGWRVEMAAPAPCLRFWLPATPGSNALPAAHACNACSSVCPRCRSAAAAAGLRLHDHGAEGAAGIAAARGAAVCAA